MGVISTTSNQPLHAALSPSAAWHQAGGRAGGRDAQKTHRHLDGRTRRLLQNFSLQASLESSVRLERSVSGDPSWRDRGAGGLMCDAKCSSQHTRRAIHSLIENRLQRTHSPISKALIRNSLWCLIMITNYITKYINI